MADRPKENKGLDRQAAGFGPAPSLERAASNLASLGFAQRVRLVKAPMQEYLAHTDERFDLIYITVSHHCVTTCMANQLGSSVAPGGLPEGDDCSDERTLGGAPGPFERYAPVTGSITDGSGPPRYRRARMEKPVGRDPAEPSTTGCRRARPWPATSEATRVPALNLPTTIASS